MNPIIYIDELDKINVGTAPLPGRGPLSSRPAKWRSAVARKLKADVYAKLCRLRRGTRWRASLQPGALQVESPVSAASFRRDALGKSCRARPPSLREGAPENIMAAQSAPKTACELHRQERWKVQIAKASQNKLVSQCCTCSCSRNRESRDFGW